MHTLSHGAPVRFGAARLGWLVSLSLAHGWACAQATASLPAVTVNATPQADARLRQPASTGSNLGQSPLQTPASVDIIGREEIEARGDSWLTDALVRATGVSSLAHPGNSGAALSVRGFTDATSVMQLYDGMRQYGGVGVSFPFDTWAVERIEVLRGPSAVILGEGAIGGVVNVVPKKPTQGPIVNEVQMTAGTRGSQGLAFGSGGAIDDRLSYRLDVSGNRSNGWVDQGNFRNTSVSGALQYQLTRDLQLSLSRAEGDQHPMRYFGIPLVDGVQLPALRERNYNVADSSIRYRDKWTELGAKWTPDAQTTVRTRFYQVSSDRYWHNAETYTYNDATGLIDRTDSTEIAHRQRQVGNTSYLTRSNTLWNLPNQLSVGFDVNHTSFRHSNNTYTGDSGSVDPYNPVPGLYQSSVPFIPRFENKADAYAVFAEDRLELTPKWSVVGGLRYDHAAVSRTNLVTDTPAFDAHFSHVGARIGAVYRWDADTSFYGQYSQAADPVSSFLFLSPSSASYKLATGRQVEVGVKQALPDGRGAWTVALYQITKNNLVTRDPQDPASSLQIGRQSSRGVEGTLAWAFTRTLRLDVNAAWLRARYDDFNEAVGGVSVSRSGNVPTDVPERLANVWVAWRALPGWTVSGGLRYEGARFADIANTLKLPAYTTFDAALRWDLAKGTTLTLRGFNVFDKSYFTTAYYSGTQWLVGERRRVQMTLNHTF